MKKTQRVTVWVAKIIECKGEPAAIEAVMASFLNTHLHQLSNELRHAHTLIANKAIHAVNKTTDKLRAKMERYKYERVDIKAPPRAPGDYDGPHR